MQLEQPHEHTLNVVAGIAFIIVLSLIASHQQTIVPLIPLLAVAGNTLNEIRLSLRH